MDEDGFGRMKEEGQIYKTLPRIFHFWPQDLVMIFQSLVITFFDFERPYLSSWAKIKNSEATFFSHEHAKQVCQISWR